MCRLFGTISLDSVDAPWLLDGAPQSLRKQSFIDKRRLQGDGWGIGWFDRGRPKIRKSAGRLYRERDTLLRAARRVRGRVLVGHVRWASNPLRLKRSELIGLAHTQPFHHGRWIFAHNGTLYIPREVKAALGASAKFVRGRNDSEVLFYWLLKHLKTSSATAMAASIEHALAGLGRIWAQCRSRYPLYPFPYHGLNWVLTDGRMLAAFCWVNPKGFDKARALGNRREPYFQLRYLVSERSVTVASEPLDHRERWRAMRHGELLLARPTRDGIRVQLKLTAPSKRR